MRRAAASLLAGVAVAGCGGPTAGAARPQPVIVSAAASLTEALRACARSDPGLEPRLSFAGSGELAGQLRRGVEPDVYLAADTRLPQELAAEGLVERPVALATNDLVLAVTAGSSIDELDDLSALGTTLVLGSESVPVGSLARRVLGRLPAAREQAILANVRSEEPDVKGVVGKLVQGAADAGFVYDTDVRATRGALRAIRLPAELRPSVVYRGAVVDGAPHPQAARAYLSSVIAGACARSLRRAGFEPPPAR